MFPFLQSSPNATEKRVPEHKGTSKNINFDKIYETSIVYCRYSYRGEKKQGAGNFPVNFKKRENRNWPSQKARGNKDLGALRGIKRIIRNFILFLWSINTLMKSARRP